MTQNGDVDQAAARSDLDRWLPLVAAGGVAVAALVQTLLVRSVGETPPGLVDVLVGWGLPGLLWVLAAPVLVRAGRRLRTHRSSLPRVLATHVAVFVVWLGAVNLLIRVASPGWSGWDALSVATVGGMVRYAPTSALLYTLLLLVGRWAAGPDVDDDPLSEAPVRPAPGTLPVPGLNRVHLVPVARIRYLEADGDHVRVHTCDTVHRVRGTLTSFERQLKSRGDFLRIHRSTLVNRSRVREVQPYLHGDWVAVLDDGTELRVPRTRRGALEGLLGS